MSIALRVIEPFMKTAHAILMFSLLCLTACASVQIDKKGAFPFRAAFEIEGTVEGKPLGFSGALLADSADNAVAQIYGPGGIAVYTVRINGRSISVTDSWNAPVMDFKLPINGIAGIFAGIAPSGFKYSKNISNECKKVSYIWGYVILDAESMPLQMRINDKEPVKADFRTSSGGIDLMIERGSDNFVLHINVIEGGRWNYADSKVQDMREKDNLE